MRALILFSLCLPGLAHPQDLQSCAQIKSAVQRLDCFDRLARDNAPAPAVKTAPENRATVKSDQAAITTPEGVRVTDVIERQPGESKRVEKTATSRLLFGLKPKKDPGEEITLINATIEKVEYMGNGKKVFTLSNDQVWIEREPSPQKIAAGQPVMIIKRRWHFELDPEQGPRVTVERLDPDTNLVRAKNRGEL